MNNTEYIRTDLEQETHFFFPQLRESPDLVLHPMNKPYQKPPVTRHYRDYSPGRLGTHVLPFSGLDAHLFYGMTTACVLLSQKALGSWFVIGFSCLNIGA